MREKHTKRDKLIRNLEESIPESVVPNKLKNSILKIKLKRIDRSIQAELARRKEQDWKLKNLIIEIKKDEKIKRVIQRGNTRRSSLIVSAL